MEDIEMGEAQQIRDEEKWITPLFYQGSSFEFTFRNKYVKISGIETNNYGKKFVTIKSKEYADKIKDVADNHDCINPLQPDGSFRAYINDKTTFSKDVGNCSFNACISIIFPTIYSDSKKKTLQIYLKDVVVTEITTKGLEVDMNNLSLSI